MKTNYYNFKKLLLSVLLIGNIMNLSATIHTVDATQNLVFVPASLNVIVGDTIRWINVGTTVHTTTSVTIPQGAPGWNYTFTGNGDTYDYEVTMEGTYDYTCTIHPGMNGQFTASASTSIEESTIDAFSIYPNPALDDLKIIFNENIDVLEWNITNLIGKVLIKNKTAIREKELKIDLNDLPAGIYIFNMRNNEKSISKAIIKKG